MPTDLPPKLAPTVLGQHGPVPPTLCRLSPDRARLAFWVPEANPPGLFVGAVKDAENLGLFARRVHTPGPGEELSDLAWSADGQYLAFTATSGPPPGSARVEVLRLSDGKATSLPGLSHAWAGAEATLLVADPASSRLYLRDMHLGVEHAVCAIADDGDPHFPPAISVSPDQRRMALVVRQAQEDRTRVFLAHHDGRTWQAAHLTDVPGAALRVLPFWSGDSAACALFVIDLAQHHSAVVAIPSEEGPGQVLYTSDSVDAAITPATHPQGRLIAMVRAHPRTDAPTLVENRLVLLDPVEHAVAPLTEDSVIVGQLRFLDEDTLLVEGREAVWTVALRAAEEHEAPGEEPPAPERRAPARAAAGLPTTPTLVQSGRPEWRFTVDIPDGWRRVPLPPEPADFADPTVMQPLCVYAPPHAAVIFTASVRPLDPGAAPAAALTFLARTQGFEVEPARDVLLPIGPAAEAGAVQRGEDGAVMRMRLVVVERGGWLFALTGMAPDPLWPILRPTLDQIIHSFRPAAE